MALTKAQVSLVTVATLGAAPGGFLAELEAFNTQKELAAFIASAIPAFNQGTNAEFALQVAKNLGATDALSIYTALEAGTSRADAAVNFANAQLVAQNGNIASVNAATASNSVSKELVELQAEIKPKATAATDSTIIEFKDNNGSEVNLPNNPNKDETGEPVPTKQTVAYIGKDQIVNGKATAVAADFKFQIKDQIGHEDTFKGLFLSPILESQKAEATGSQVILELRNLREPADSSTPLKSLPTNGIAFSLNGVVLKVDSQAIDDAQTYADLRIAIEARLAELARGENIPTSPATVSHDAADYAQLATFTTTEGAVFRAQNETGAIVTGTSIVLTDTAGAKLEPLAFTQSDDVIIGTGYTLYGELKKAEAKEIAKLISTNLEADNLGYGSQGATVNLVGQSASNKGVEEIKLTAKNGVWFTTLKSETAASGDKVVKNHLQSIQLQSGSEGSFNVGTQQGNTVKSLYNAKTEEFELNGLTDVREVVANNAGSTAINSFISKDVLNREYNLKDTGVFGSDDVAINYNLSSGRDVLNLAVDQKVMEAVDTKVSIDTGAGNDIIHFQVSNTTTTTIGGVTTTTTKLADNGTWLTNQQLLNNVVVNAGDGNDQVVLTGSGNVTVNAGTGDDEVRADNTGDRAVFLFNNGNTTDVTTLSNSDNTLSSGFNNVAQSYNLFKATVKVTFLGFESKAIVIDSTNFKTSTLQINQAIKKAIAESPQLSKLLAAHDNAGHALGIESLVDGKLNLADLNIKITAPDDYKPNETAAEQAARVASGQEMLSSTDLLDAAKSVNPTTTTPISFSELTNAANNLNNSVYNAEFATTSDSTVPQIQTINFEGISSLPAGHALSGDGASITIGGVQVKIATGMDSAAIAQAAVKAIAAEASLGTNTKFNGFQKAEAVGSQVKVYFSSDKPLLTISESTNTGASGFLSTKSLQDAVWNTATGTAGVAASFTPATVITPETKGFDLTFNGAKVSAANDGKVTISFGTNYDSIEVTVAKGAGSLAIANAVAAKLNGQINPNATGTTAGADTLTAKATLVDDKITVTLANQKATAATPTLLLSTDANITGTAPTVANTANTSLNIAPITAVTASSLTQTLEFAGLQVTEAGSINIGNVNVLLPKGANDLSIAAEVAKVLGVTGVTGTTVTLPTDFATTEVVKIVVNAGFASTQAKPSISVTQTANTTGGIENVVKGSNSDAESDNRIDLGQGTDLVMMGTGKNSNDTLVLTGYKTQTNTVVNFDRDANSDGRDFLDLSAYVAGQNKVVLGAVNNAPGTLVNNSVAKLSVAAADFAKLTDSEMLAQLNGTAAAGTAITGLAGIDAVAGGTANSNYVLMVENADNASEYKVFHLTANAGANAGKFANAQTVATLDFGVQTAAQAAQGYYEVALAGTAAGSLAAFSTDPSLVKGLAVNVNNTTITKANVDKLNSLGLTDLVFRFPSTSTATLESGTTLNVANLTVWGGTLDATQSTMNFTLTNGTITLNSGLKISVAQAEQLANSSMKITSGTGTASIVQVIADTAADKAKLAAVKAKLDAKFDTSGGGSKPEAVELKSTDTLLTIDASTTAQNLGAVGANVKVVISGSNTVTANGTIDPTASITVGSGSNLTGAAAQLTGATVTGAGNVAVTALTGSADLSKITATGTKTVALVADATLDAAAKLGSFDVDVSTHALTATAAQLNGLNVTGTGTVNLTAATATELTTANAAKFAAGLTVNAELAAAAGDLSTQTLTNIDKLDLSKADVAALVVSEAQALTLTGAGANDVITVKAVTADTAKIAAVNTAIASADATVTVELAAGTVDISAATYANIDKFDLGGGGTDVVVNLTATADQIAPAVLTNVGATDTITVNTLTGKTVAATAAKDTFVLANTDTGVTITGFSTGTDKVNLKAFTAETATTAVVADADFTITTDKVYFISGAADDTDAATSITTAIGTGTITDTANTAYVVIADADSSSIYKWTGDAQGDGVTGDTLALIGTVDAALATTNLLFA